MTNDKLVEFLNSLKRVHLIHEDCWYNCPLSDDGCCNDEEKLKCNCGAEEFNNKIDGFIEENILTLKENKNGSK